MMLRHPTSSPVLAAALAATVVAGCGDDPPRRDCLARIWIPASEHGTTVVGSWNGWAAPGVVPEPYDGAWQVARNTATTWRPASSAASFWCAPSSRSRTW